MGALYKEELTVIIYKKDTQALKPRLNSLNSLPSVFQKANFLPIEFKIHALEDYFMQLLVAECLEN